jgi:deaminated glutathione amidase
MTTFRAALIQMRSGRDIIRNRDDMVELMREAAVRGADYIQTPEMTSLVERDRDKLLAQVVPEDQDPVLMAACEEARQLKCTLHLGSLAIKSGDKIANRAFIINADGVITSRYDKIHLFDVDLPDGKSWRESNTYQAGHQPIIADMPFGKLGLSICYDLRFASLYRSYAEQGAMLLSAPACFTNVTGEAHWHILQRARAIETGSFMLSAAQGGLHEDGRESFGHSLIIDPWGRILAEGGREPGIVMADIDLSLAESVRRQIPVLTR